MTVGMNEFILVNYTHTRTNMHTHKPSKKRAYTEMHICGVVGVCMRCTALGITQMNCPFGDVCDI